MLIAELFEYSYRCPQGHHFVFAIDTTFSPSRCGLWPLDAARRFFHARALIRLSSHILGSGRERFYIYYRFHDGRRPPRLSPHILRCYCRRTVRQEKAGPARYFFSSAPAVILPAIRRVADDDDGKRFQYLRRHITAGPMRQPSSRAPGQHADFCSAATISRCGHHTIASIRQTKGAVRAAYRAPLRMTHSRSSFSARQAPISTSQRQ